jgi:hypothetical protein
MRSREEVQSDGGEGVGQVPGLVQISDPSPHNDVALLLRTRTRANARNHKQLRLKHSVSSKGYGDAESRPNTNPSSGESRVRYPPMAHDAAWN